MWDELGCSIPSLPGPALQSFVSVLLVGQQSDSEIAEKVYELMLELSKVDPSTLTAVLPQLEFKLKVCVGVGGWVGVCVCVCGCATLSSALIWLLR